MAGYNRGPIHHTFIRLQGSGLRERDRCLARTRLTEARSRSFHEFEGAQVLHERS